MQTIVIIVFSTLKALVVASLRLKFIDIKGKLFLISLIPVEIQLLLPVGVDKVPSLISDDLPYALVDVYLVYIVQSACFILPAIFCVFCSAIREASTKLGDDMLDDDVDHDLYELRRRCIWTFLLF